MGFRTMLLLGSLLLHAYVFWRAATVPWIAARVRWRALAAVAAALWAGTAAAQSLAHGAAGTAAAIVELMAMDWLAALFLVATALLAVDVVTVFGLVLRRPAPRLRGAALVAGGVLTCLAVIQGMRAPVVTDEEVQLPGLPAEADGLVVVAVSDLHVGALLGRGWLAARIDQINRLAPAVIVLLGDIVEGHGIGAEEVVPVLDRLAAPLGVLAVTGNHEGYGDRGGGRWLDRAGVNVLRNQCVAVREGLSFAGIDARSLRRSAGAADDPVPGALSQCPPGAVILLSHYPTRAERAAECGADLLLSGHTHGGQVWPFGQLVATEYPLLAGRYLVAGMPVIVSRGAGTWGPRMRLWRAGEILRVTLRAGEPAA